MLEKRVWIFKDKKDNNDEYDSLLIKNNYSPEFIPLLDYTCQNVDMLKSMLITGPHALNLSGLILTSQKSVHTLTKAYTPLKDEIRQQWHELPVFVVGPQTEQLLAQSPLYSHCHTNHWIEAPRALELIKPIIDHYNKKGQLLFLAGDKRRDVIPQALTEAKIPFLEVQTYATCPHPDLPARLQQLEQAEAEWAVFFSPSGLKFIQSALPTSKLLQSGQIKIAAIGPTTADYIHALGLTVHAVAEKPDAKHLVDAVVKFDMTGKYQK
ncbi:unnamed protein product [Rhizopus microsporus]